MNLSSTCRERRPAAGTACWSGNRAGPVIARLYATRGAGPEDLPCRLQDLAPPHGLNGFLGMDVAARLLSDAILRQTPITIIGDYDCDGACSSAILAIALREIGHDRVDILIPNRVQDGYGLTPAIAGRIAEDAGLVITVDNGVSALDGVEAVKARGMRIIVTDHHLAGDVLPSPDAMVNPNQPGCPFPWKGTCGAGVAWYLLVATRTRLREVAKEDQLEQGLQARLAASRLDVVNLLDLVALATVADVVPLERNNRILVAEGLRRIRAGKTRPGIDALIQASGRDRAYLTSSDFGFALGPRINAAGRLDDMMTGIRLLMTEDVEEALTLAAELDRMNRERRNIEDGIRAEAETIVEGVADRLDGSLPHVLCLSDAGWHEGVVGIVAGRIKERYHRPTFVFARAVEPGMLKGSGRSIPGFHLRDALALVDARHPGLIHRFGGHAMAAGLSLPAERFAEFAELMERVARETMDPAVLESIVWTDGHLRPEEFTLDTAQAITDAGPWGQAFPEPLFHGTFRVMESDTMKGGHWRLKLVHPEGGFPVPAVYFLRGEERDDPPPPPAPGVEVTCLYTASINRWQGNEKLQVVVQELVGGRRHPIEKGSVVHA